jgi:hypothetical protein
MFLGFYFGLEDNNSSMASKAALGSFSQQEEKDMVLDSLYWIKQVVALLIGLTVGSLHLTGFVIILGFGILISVTSLFYAWQIVRANDLEPWELVTEAFGPSFFCFMLSWVLTFTFVQPIS